MVGVEAWLPVVTVPELRDGAIQVWWARPDDADPGHDALLAADELARRERLRRGDDRDRLTVAAALARLVLASHLDVDTAAVHFDRTCDHCGEPHGKPRLPDGDGLQFSISHSGDRVAVAVVRGAEIGVDVEQVRPGLSVDTMSDTVLTPAEAAALPTGADRLHGFLTYWTRKEAVLKATGDGLRAPLRELAVSAPGEPPAVLSWPRHPGPFHLHDLHPGAGYLASVATVEHPAATVHELAGAGLLARR